MDTEVSGLTFSAVYRANSLTSGNAYLVIFNLAQHALSDEAKIPQCLQLASVHY